MYLQITVFIARYWEACTTVHQLMSKWMDATVFAAVFHLQSKHHVTMRPPSFFEYDELNRLNLTRDREHWSTYSTSSLSQEAVPSNYMGYSERWTRVFQSNYAPRPIPRSRTGPNPIPAIFFGGTDPADPKSSTDHQRKVSRTVAQPE